MKKLCHIIGFPILSKLIRGHTVELEDVCFIPDDQFVNEANNNYACVVFDPKTSEESNLADSSAGTPVQQLKAKIATYQAEVNGIVNKYCGTCKQCDLPSEMRRLSANSAIATDNTQMLQRSSK